MSKTDRPVLVTTEYRGVFAGILSADSDETARTLALTDVRMAIYWSQEMRGVAGLASIGPSEDCRVGARADRVVLHEVTAVWDISTEAWTKWTSS